MQNTWNDIGGCLKEGDTSLNIQFGGLAGHVRHPRRDTAEVKLVLFRCLLPGRMATLQTVDSHGRNSSTFDGFWMENEGTPALISVSKRFRLPFRSCSKLYKCHRFQPEFPWLGYLDTPGHGAQGSSCWPPPCHAMPLTIPAAAPSAAMSLLLLLWWLTPGGCLGDKPPNCQKSKRPGSEHWKTPKQISWF